MGALRVNYQSTILDIAPAPPDPPSETRPGKFDVTTFDLGYATEFAGVWLFHRDGYWHSRSKHFSKEMYAHAAVLSQILDPQTAENLQARIADYSKSLRRPVPPSPKAWELLKEELASKVKQSNARMWLDAGMTFGGCLRDSVKVYTGPDRLLDSLLKITRDWPHECGQAFPRISRLHWHAGRMPLHPADVLQKVFEIDQRDCKVIENLWDYATHADYKLYLLDEWLQVIYIRIRSDLQALSTRSQDNPSQRNAVGAEQADLGRLMISNPAPPIRAAPQFEHGWSAPGYLGISIHPSSRRIKRDGYEHCIVDCKPRREWTMFVTVLKTETEYCPDRTVRTLVWDDYPKISDGAIHATKTGLRKKLEPLGLKISKTTDLGWLIEDC